LLCDVQFERGLIYQYSLSENDEAEKCYADVLNSYPDNKLATMAKHHLESMQVKLKKSLTDSTSNTFNSFTLNNYPNPFNPSTTISYNLPVTSRVEITIYDVLGREIKNFSFSSQSAGRQNVVWSGTDNNNEEVASGVYLYHFKAVSLEKKNEVFEKSAKLILMK
jgi:FlgD Ig-like domain